jgi:hypothetical protein
LAFSKNGVARTGTSSLDLPCLVATCREQFAGNLAAWLYGLDS